MKLATKMSTATQLISHCPIADSRLQAIAPSIFASEAHERVGANYGYVPTVRVVSALRKEGFEPFFVAQAKTRTEGRREYTKHMLRFRHTSQIARREVPEIILVNSHDGSTSYQMLAGMFRFVCCNGLVVGDSIDEIRIKHSGNVVDRVIEGAYQVLDQSARVMHSADSMKALTLSEPEQRVFANAAIVARYGEEKAPVSADQLLRVERSDDKDSNLWNTFNRVQEHMVRGGLRGRTNGRRSTTRAINGIGQNVSLNRALWTLADQMLKLKAN